MAIFHYRVGERISRGRGQSAVRAAAYQARERFQDERTGYTYNSLPRAHSSIAAKSAYDERSAGYDEGRRAALFVGLYAPKDAPEWCRGRENIATFWNRAELAERRQDAQIAERIIIALPHELTLQQNIWLLQDHVKEFTRQGRIVQVAIHEPEHSGPGAERNIHAHLLVSLRGVDEHGFKATKTAEQQQRYLHRREYVTELRKSWADLANHHLGRHGHAVRIDHRTLAEQGIDRAPTIHLGPGDSRRERQGERSAAGEVNRELAAQNSERARQSIDRAVGRAHHRETRTQGPAQPREVEVVDLDAWRRRLEQEPQRPVSVAPPASAAAREADRKPATQAEAERASGAREIAQERKRGGGLRKMLGRVFETARDWIAPVVADPHQQPVPQQPPPPPPREPEKPEGQKPLSVHERTERRRQRREREEGRDGEQGSPLYQRFQAEREAAHQTRRAAEQDVRERFVAYAQDARNFYDRQFDETRVAGLPGPVIGEAMRMLSALRRGDRGTAIRLEREAIAEVRRTHELPSWGEFLEREAAKGDQEAARAFERHKAREAERNRDRGDEGRGIEP